LRGKNRAELGTTVTSTTSELLLNMQIQNMYLILHWSSALFKGSQVWYWNILPQKWSKYSISIIWRGE